MDDAAQAQESASAITGAKTSSLIVIPDQGSRWMRHSSMAVFRAGKAGKIVAGDGRLFIMGLHAFRLIAPLEDETSGMLSIGD